MSKMHALDEWHRSNRLLCTIGLLVKKDGLQGC